MERYWSETTDRARFAKWYLLDQTCKEVTGMSMTLLQKMNEPLAIKIKSLNHIDGTEFCDFD